LAWLGFAASVAHAQGTEQVVYDNQSTLSALGPNYLFDERNNFSTLVGNDTVTALVGDDLIFKQQAPPSHPPIIPAPMRLTKISFFVTNRNTAAVTIRPLLRIWDDDSQSLGDGVDHPGTLLRGINLGPITLAAAPSASTFSSTLVTVDLTGGTAFGGLNIPNGPGIAGDPYRVWAGLAFDNNSGRTGATLDQMNNVGQLVNDINNNGNPLVGRSGDVAWGTNNTPGSPFFGDPGADLWARNLPPGAFFNYFNDPNHPGADGIPGTDDDPFANFAWKVWARPGFVMPEPGTAGLMAPVGLTAGFLLWRRRNRRSH
jgi:hypothetical protein